MSIVFAILLFSVLIFVHELGHFICAKLSGVQVNEFSMFMGPAIAKWHRGETLYTIRCIPIGGFCAMEGEDADTDSPRSFQKAAWWKRLIILVAGSAMNFVIGFLLLAITFSPAKAVNVPVIASAEEGCTIVSENGLHIGDRLLEVDGEKIYVTSDFSMLLSLNPGNVHDLVVERDGEIVELNDFTMEKHLFSNAKKESYGIRFDIEEVDFLGKLKWTWKQSQNVVRIVRMSIQMLFTGKAGIQDMTGPVGIVQVMSETAQESENAQDALMNLLYFGGFVAINLAVMNLLPFPALDGGRVVGLLLTTLIEAVTRKKINPKYEGYVHGAGMILLLALMAVVMFKDIFTIFKG